MDALLQQIALPDLWQQEAVHALREGRDVIVDAPTGAGKTRVFELFAKEAKFSGTPSAKQAVYTVPTRALANDKWAEWREQGWNVGIATGDLAVNTDAPVVVATLETQRERFLAGRGPALLIVDEYQMLSDPTRGLHYELILTLAPTQTQLLLLSGSVGNPARIASWLESHDRRVTLVSTQERPVPLDDVHLLGLPHQAPKFVKGFWARLAAEVLLGDMGPLLIFVPHRKGAENVARQVSDALPLHDPMALSSAQKQLAGKELQKMLTKRVCYHHSGLRYELRAGLLEPLARAGQLRVIVATMGLAAGINFSVRSVFVAEATYHDGPFLHHLQSDELLQMFGRAGRRGKDSVGYVIHGDKNPRLTDARARNLKRAHEIDWPTLLRVMHLAALDGKPPFAAAVSFCGKLFSDQPILLGVESTSSRPTPQSPGNGGAGHGAHPSFALGPTRREILNSSGQWEPFEKHREGETSLDEALVYRDEKWRAARGDFSLIAQQTTLGQARRKDDSKGAYLIKEMVLATRPESSAPWRLTKSLSKRLAKGDRNRFRKDPTLDRQALKGALELLIENGIVGAPTENSNQLVAQIDFRSLIVSAYQDRTGAWLIDPPQRLGELEMETDVIPLESPAAVEPPADSPAHSWRQLGLIDADGTPTRRGIIFSFFYHGEGLAIAAGLEASDYPVDDLLWHLANLRSGYRFQSLEGTDGERLAIVCRHTYGPVNYPGYLRLGVPIQYGEGAAEAVRSQFQAGRQRSLRNEELGRGDLERVIHEWMSLLRQIAHAPTHEWDRWRQLQAEAESHLSQLASQVKPFTTIDSTLNVQQRQIYTRQRLHFGDFRRS